MHPRSFILCCLAALFSVVLAAPVNDGDLVPRAAHLVVREGAEPKPPRNLTYVKYNKLKPMPETIPDGKRGGLYKQFQPYFYAEQGCVPYPAIDADGRVSKGISADKSTDDDVICADSKGQVYVRSGKYKKHFAIMYSWYMPRDATWTEELKKGSGHRHEWENAIVWLKKGKLKAKIVGLSLSAHGGYKYHKRYKMAFKGKRHAYVKYAQPFDMVRNHQLLKGSEDDPAQLQPMVAWESMTDKQRLVMNTPQAFGGTTSGVRDTDFKAYLEMAYADVIAEE